jgi:hypothetical protein
MKEIADVARELAEERLVEVELRAQSCNRRSRCVRAEDACRRIPRDQSDENERDDDNKKRYGHGLRYGTADPSKPKPPDSEVSPSPASNRVRCNRHDGPWVS